MKTAPARATVTIAAVTTAAYAAQSLVPAGMAIEVAGGFVPARLSGTFIPGALPVWITPLSSALLHGGLMHLGFNLLLLLFCGREDEVAIGPRGLVILYVVGAYAAAGAQWIAFPTSSVPIIGASGAISALVGAYALLYGQRRPSRLPREIARWAHIAWLAAGWVGLQMLVGFASATTGVMIATAAHIGGFVAGLMLGRPLLRWRYRLA